MKQFWSHIMKKIHLTNDLGKKEVEEKWKGKFLDDTSYNEVFTITEDTGIMRPGVSLDGSDVPLGYFITNAYDDNDLIKNTLMSITDVSTMRANASGPILEEDMLKKGLVKDVDYKLRTENSYYVKTKSGKWGMIAYGNEIHSIMIGYKRGRFTGTIDKSGWCNDNPDKWEKLQTLPYWNERAYEKANLEMFNRQKTWVKTHIKEEHRIKGSIVTTMSANKYNAAQSRAMSAHLDSGDYADGFSTMAVFRDGDFSGALLTFPQYGIAVDIPDGTCALFDSNTLHGVTPIKGEGTRHSITAYTDTRLATIGAGRSIKSENPIGHHHRDKKGNLEAFFT